MEYLSVNLGDKVKLNLFKVGKVSCKNSWRPDNYNWVVQGVLKSFMFQL